ncbi:DUF4282 domain-containing protein [Devosia sp.]|uniref:DUF4282 domain-containing protein n=1 Tax=Devosia sp. TaxID=1871048 RepID=UPI0035AF259A
MLEDLKKIFLSPALFRLDTILSPRLVPILYGTGMAALLLWAVGHLFLTFGRNFGDGLWGILEIAVFGALGMVALRVICELLLVFFKANETATRTVSLSRMPGTLMDEVKEAIHEIAQDDAYGEDVAPEAPPAPPRRTARRTPPAGTPEL